MQFYKKGEIPNVGNMYFVYGGKSTGKTYMAIQFKGKKPMFNFDGSTNAIASTKDIRVIAFEHSDAPNIQRDLMYWLDNQLYKVNENGERVLTGEFNAIIFDNVTALQNWVINNVENASKDDRYKDNVRRTLGELYWKQFTGEDKTVIKLAPQDLQVEIKKAINQLEES